MLDLTEMEKHPANRIDRNEQTQPAPPRAEHVGGDEDNAKRRKLGIFTADALAASVKRDAATPFLIEGLVRKKSVNLLVGDSGLGKTPLAIQMSLCIAAGLPLFGRNVEAGAVLYCDAESGKHDFCETIHAVSRFLGLEEPPRNFNVWSPTWEVESASDEWRYPSSTDSLLKERIEITRPTFVVIDAFRTFWSDAETKNQVAADTIAGLRKIGKGITWLLLHHRRKANQLAGVPDLADDPRGWFQETAGALALVNHSDTRIGAEPQRPPADLQLGGFIRGIGSIVPMDLARVSGEDGNPIGYRLMTGVDLLSADDRHVYENLPDRLRFRDVKARMAGNSDSNVKRFLDRCAALELLRKDALEYVKVKAVEQVEQVE